MSCACPVKHEIYRVATRYEMCVKVVAKNPQRVPGNERTELIVKPDFGAVDDWIVDQSGPGDIVITADIPLAARCLTKEALVLDPRGYRFTDNDIGSALASASSWKSCVRSVSIRADQQPLPQRIVPGSWRNSMIRSMRSAEHTLPQAEFLTPLTVDTFRPAIPPPA